ncbi:MAG: diguanylate cyclase [Tepidimonas sp.]|uniref:diguanylate cyclase n=1 Tax=Tepidimonas sp. TaxID=2002775 RepID=UPI00405534ED
MTSAASGSMQTLLVDPGGASSALLMAALKRYGLAVWRAGSVEEALAQAQRERLDLVITAWVLPDGDGIALARRLRPLLNEAAPIILISASVSPERLDEAFLAGITDVFTRDDLEHLDNFLRYFLASRTDTVIGARLLLVEDSPAQQQHLTAMLQRRGYEVDVASSVDAAREHMRQHDHELYLVDLVLLGMQSGIGLIRQLRRTAEDFVLRPVIVLTGYHDTARKNELYRLGVNDYVIKPPPDVELLARVYNLIYMRRLYQQLREREQLLQTMALTDPVTGIANRHTYDEAGPRYLERTRRDGKPMAVMVVDIDHFKRVNDRHGHAYGDEVLTMVAQLMAQSVRANDLVARYGGEEFVALLPGCGQPCALRVAEQLRHGVATRVSTPDGPVTVSIGIAVIEPAAAETLEHAFERADKALYQAKTAGRNCVKSANDEH